MNNYLQTGKYLFKCQLLDDAVLPPYKGSTFRGAFGVALKRVVCAVRENNCDACLLKPRCIYARIFETKDSPADVPQKVAAPPHPYVIEPPLTRQCQFKAGESFHFTLLLFGEANEYLPYFVYAFEAMGEQGIGKRVGERRARFTLTCIEMDGKAIYDVQRRKLAAGATRPLALAPPSEEASPGRLTLRFQTPLRLKFENQLSADLPFHLLVRAMLRRISSLFAFHGTGEPALDYRGLVFQAKEVATSSSTLHWLEWERYSNRHQQTMLMGGMAGNVSYEEVPAHYLPLVELCRILHIGKQSSFGLGQFDYTWEETPA